MNTDTDLDTQTTTLNSDPGSTTAVLASAVITPTRTLTLVDHPTNMISPTTKTLKTLKLAGGASGFSADTKLTVLVRMGVGLVLTGAYIL